MPEVVMCSNVVLPLQDDIAILKKCLSWDKTITVGVQLRYSNITQLQVKLLVLST